MKSHSNLSVMLPYPVVMLASNVRIQMLVIDDNRTILSDNIVNYYNVKKADLVYNTVIQVVFWGQKAYHTQPTA